MWINKLKTTQIQVKLDKILIYTIDYLIFTNYV
jgi:hypothetical protein